MATLFARLDKDHEFKSVAVKFNPKTGKPIPVDGATRYNVRYTAPGGKRTSVKAGSDLQEAAKQYSVYQSVEDGAVVDLAKEFKENAVPAPNSNGRLSLQLTADEYIASITDDYEKKKIAKSTYVSYRKAVEDFARFCESASVKYLDELTGKILVDHETWLYKTLQRRNKGEAIYTVASRFRYLNTFLGKNGIKAHKDKISKLGDTGLMDYNKFPWAPKRSERNPYEPEEVEAMLEAAKSMIEPTAKDPTPWTSKTEKGEQRGGFMYKKDAQTALDLIHFALKTGFRDGEIQHAEWDEVDWRRGTITTGSKPSQFDGWTTKSGLSRKIDIPSLVDRLRIRKENQVPTSPLIFPNDVGRPDADLIWFLQEVVKRVKYDGGRVKGEIGLHRFRYTTADHMMEQPDFNIEDLRVFLGHQDIKTTWLYLRANKKRQRKASETAFDAYGD